MSELIIRNEVESDYTKVEKLTREAFWNLYEPGCSEHYLVHVLRQHEDFISQLDYVAEQNGTIVGNVMYTKAKLIDKEDMEKSILTFGPLSVAPEYQRKGAGKALLEVSFKKAVELGYDAIVIFGNPGNYVSRGFVSCKKCNVCIENEKYPTAMLVKELKPGVFDGRSWNYNESPAYNINVEDVEEFDKLFDVKEKKYQTSQEEFYIYSHSSIE